MKDLEYAQLVSSVIELRNDMKLDDEIVALLLISRQKAVCRRSLIGSHKCSVVLERPNHPTKPKISCDACLYAELKSLWSMGINTVGSCCGHGINPAFIEVDDKSVPLMVQLGYQPIPTDRHGNGTNCFKPYTLFLEKSGDDV